MSWKSQCTIAPTVFLAASVSAFACDPSMYSRWQAGKVDEPVTTLADCSFTDTDAYTDVDDDEYYLLRVLSGAPVRDIGNGRIAQRISEPSCGMTEHLLFVDCTTAEAVMIRGVEEPGLKIDGYYNPEFLIKFIQPPYGNAGVTASTTVEDLSRRANSADYGVISEVNDYFESPYYAIFEDPDQRIDLPYKLRRKSDRYDVSCGCKLYYPGSVGAEN